MLYKLILNFKQKRFYKISIPEDPCQWWSFKYQVISYLEDDNEARESKNTDHADHKSDIILKISRHKSEQFNAGYQGQLSREKHAIFDKNTIKSIWQQAQCVIYTTQCNVIKVKHVQQLLENLNHDLITLTHISLLQFLYSFLLLFQLLHWLDRTLVFLLNTLWSEKRFKD